MKSTCCRSDVRVVGQTTQYYACMECGAACDIESPEEVLVMKSTCCGAEVTRQEPTLYGIPYYRCNRCKEKCEAVTPNQYAGMTYHEDSQSRGLAEIAKYDQARSSKDLEIKTEEE